MIIAIDGPSGAGKSTVSKAVARKLAFSCLDTGAMYRSIAWYALRDGIDLSDAEKLGDIARTKEISFGLTPGDPLPSEVFIDGINVTRDIRTAQIDRSVSAVAAHSNVREALVMQQRRIGASGNFVVEGRDIGTAVFPSAEVKVFLTASDEQRALRRLRQNESRGIGSVDYEEVLADIKARDRLDSSRETSPLKPAHDATIIDSSSLPIEDVVSKICEMAQSKAVV